MQTQTIAIDKTEARRLYQAYKSHAHYSTPIDRECQRAYQLIAQGKVVIRAIESIKAAGADEQGRPLLALAPADAETVRFYGSSDGSGKFYTDERRAWSNARGREIGFPPKTFPSGRGSVRVQAPLPVIPIHLRPKRGLANYHVLWEAEWRPMPPVDPYLLRRIGKSDLWLVVAAWDLTAVEQAAMATRIPIR